MPKVPYPYEGNGKLVTGNGSLIPICSLSNSSLMPSLTVFPIIHKNNLHLFTYFIRQRGLQVVVKNGILLYNTRLIFMPFLIKFITFLQVMSLFTLRCKEAQWNYPVTSLRPSSLIVLDLSCILEMILQFPFTRKY